MDDNGTSQYKSSSDNNPGDVNLDSASAPPDVGTSQFKSNSFDNAFESASADISVGKSEGMETQLQTNNRSKVESDADRIERVLSNPDEYPEDSFIYFYNESIEEGRGRRAICSNSLSESSANERRGKQSRPHPSTVAHLDLPDHREAQLHFHIAHTHYSGTEALSSDHTSIVRAVIEESGHTIDAMKSAMKLSVKDKLDGLLARVEQTLGKRGRDIVSEIAGTFCESVMSDVDEAEHQASKRMKYSFPSDDKEVARKYTTGVNSIMKSLPVPIPEVVPDFGGAVIPVRLLVNHIIALNIPIKHFDTDDDWTDGNGNYDGEFYRIWHGKIKEMKRKGDIPEGKRIIFIRVWCDGFQAFQIKAHNEYNSVQLYTVTVIAPSGQQTKQHTLPFALCFKKWASSDVFDSLIEQCQELLQVREVYFGRDNKVMHVVPILEIIANDMPERCDNTHVCYKGTLTHRFGFSCDVSQPYASICLKCELKLISNHLHSRGMPVEDCDDCTMFGSRISSEDADLLRDVQRASPQNHIVAKLSFQQLNNAAKAVQEFADSVQFKALTSRARAPFKMQIETFLKQNGYPPKLITTLVHALQDGINIVEAALLPKIWAYCVEHCISLDQFPCLPMHMLFLGVEKNLMSQTPVLYDRKLCVEERDHWTNLTKHMDCVCKSVGDLSLDWCVSMPYTGPLGVGTSGWESENYVGFTRVSLVSFAQLDGACSHVEGMTKRILLAFKTARVLWFCLVSRVMTDDKVESSEVDRYVTLFLSACKRLHSCTEDRFAQKAEEKRGKGKKLRRRSSRSRRKRMVNQLIHHRLQNLPRSQRARRRRRQFHFTFLLLTILVSKT